ncbi:MAG: hypothetical protein WD207_04430 [Xanthobacteraceae bacterium]
MKVFLASCAVAIVLAVGAVFVLNGLQTPASVAFTAPSSVRL